MSKSSIKKGLNQKKSMTRKKPASAGKKKVSVKKWIKKFEAMMDDDFNTPKVVALLLEMVLPLA